jgi:hypothetical protein
LNSLLPCAGRRPRRNRAHNFQQPIAHAYQWPFADGGSDTQAYVAALEQAAAAPLAMFGGCYAATEFTIGERWLRIQLARPLR